MTLVRITRARIVPGLSTSPAPMVDLTIQDGMIASIEPTRGLGDGDVDADGATLLPGLWDNHVHFSLAALIDNCVRLAPEVSRAEVLAELGRHVATSERLVAYGFRSATWSPPPSAVELDHLNSSIPVAVISRDLHSVWCNTPALVLVGHPQHPTGFLVEADAFAAIRALVIGSPHLVDQAVAQFEARIAAYGVVGIVDMASGWAVDAWQHRAATRHLGLCVEAASYPEHLDNLIALGSPTGQELAPNLRVGPLKIIADGSMGSRTAYCSLPYPDALPEQPYGKLNYSAEDLTELLARATRHGITAAVHAIGDASATRVLDAFETTGALGSLEHAQCLAPTDISRMARLGLVASIQPSHQLEDADVVERVWPELQHRAYPMRDLLDAGVPLTLGSDAPVAELNPWLAIHTATARPFRPDQRLTRLEALQASTRSTIAVGQPADLVLTGDDDTVLFTMQAGRVTYRG